MKRKISEPGAPEEPPQRFRRAVEMRRMEMVHAWIGYDLKTNTWMIWNPWYDSFEYVDIYGTYIPKSNHSYRYTYTQTIYNWC